MMRSVCIVALGVMLASGLAGELRAQTSVPQTYSFTEDPAISIMAPTIITLSRDGSKEVVDQVMPPSPGRPHEFHAHLVYDFAAHKIYTRIISDPSTPCSVMNYSSPEVPPEFDAISGAAKLMGNFSGEGVQSKQIGTDTLDGIPVKVQELSSSQAGAGKMHVWLAQQGNYPVKVVMIDPSGKKNTMIEMKHLSFARPPASAFALPVGCKELQGESTESGGSVTIGGNAKKAAPPNAKVTTVTLQPIQSYTGACPAHLKMTGSITTDGPGTVWYEFGAGKYDPGETVTFSAAGTKTVTHVMTFTLDPQFGDSMGGAALLQAVVEDAKGGHDEMDATASNNSNFSVTCKR